ncbi:flagellar biosynthetic protein FliR [Pacificibacter maritimus]|uniref:Flagellar biosynthetic protein FliR n=1 Tax=Pacificibacter maritimus TaxID=762213 RepID=A0A3N4U1E6_9RHOB|nr:flagellar biosynthetic protein FliR [Pacificibacter maritimus]RPE64623.1 flagellar biosynthetic protein FliR [Pacificibacter maritimus]
MIDLLPAALGLSQQALLLGFVVFLRVGAMMAVLPAFGERSIPQRVRLALTLCFTIVVTPAVADFIAPFSVQSGAMGRAIATEVLAGLAIGIVLRLFVMILEIAGTIIAQSTSLSQMFGGGAVEAQPVVGHLLLVGGLALAAMLDLHVRVVEIIIMSYDFIPVGTFIGGATLSDWGLQHIRSGFAMAFSLSAPFVIASLVYNVALGVINRAMPQLMVAMVGAPAITLGGMALMMITLPLLLQIWQHGFDVLLMNPFGAR